MKAFTILACLMLYCTSANAEVPESLAVRAIMGEARGEPFIGKVALAEAIRNRGHLRGVYGLKVPMSKLNKEPAWVWADARRAWEESKKTNLTKGASFWENTDDFGMPYWSKGMVMTAKIGRHRFFREVDKAHKGNVRKGR